MHVFSRTVSSCYTRRPRILPPELTDIVIGYLHDDPASLKSVSLASRDMLPSTRTHLFYSIALYDSRLLDAFVALLQTSPHLAGCVKCLLVCLIREEDRAILRQLIRCLGSVHKLELTGVGVYLHAEAAKLIGPIKELVIEATILRGTVISESLSTFPQLEGLMINTSSGLPLQSNAALDFPMPSLRRLAITDSTPAPGSFKIVQKLLQQRFPLLESLSLDILDDEDLEALCTFLRMKESTLLHTDLCFKFSAQVESIVRFANLLRETCANVRSIRFASANKYWLEFLIPAIGTSNAEQVFIDILPAGTVFTTVLSVLSIFGIEEPAFVAANNIVVKVPLHERHGIPLEASSSWKNLLINQFEDQWPELFARGILKIDLPEDLV